MVAAPGVWRISNFSFHSHKNITTLGEGGMLWVRNEEHARLVPMLRHNGHCDFGFEREDYWRPAMGNFDLPMLNGKPLMPNNYCLGEVECALGMELLKRGCSQLGKTPARAGLHGRPGRVRGMEFHREAGERHNYHLLAARLSNSRRDEFIRKMAHEHGVQCVVQYYPLHRYDFYRKLGLGEATVPNTDAFFDNMVSFPFQQTLTDAELGDMAEAARSVLRQIRR